MGGRIQLRKNAVSRRTLKSLIVIGRLDPRICLRIDGGVGVHVVDRYLIRGDSNKRAEFLV